MNVLNSRTHAGIPRSAIAVAALLFSFGCSSAPETSFNTQYSGSTWAYPNPGAGYFYSLTQSGYQQFTDSISVDSIRHSWDATVAGRPKTERFGRFFDATPPMFVALEANGDISWGDSVGPPPRLVTTNDDITWTTFPTGHAAPYDVIIKHVADSVDGFGTHYWFDNSRSFLGVEQLTLAGQTWQAFHVRDSLLQILRYSDSVGINGSTVDTIIHATHWWFVPRIGFYARKFEYQFVSGRNFIPNGTVTTDAVLVRYEP